MLILKQTCTWKGTVITCTSYHCTYIQNQLSLHSFHNKLKTVYLNGKVNRWIDVLLDVLLKIEYDQYFQYELKYRLLQPNKVAFRIEDAHKRGVSISPEKVNVSTRQLVTLYTYCIVQDDYDVCDLYSIESLRFTVAHTKSIWKTLSWVYYYQNG